MGHLFREVGGSPITTSKEYAQLGDPSRIPPELWLVWYLDWWLCIFEFSVWELVHIFNVGDRRGRDRMVIGFKTLYDKVSQWFATGRWFCLDPPIPSSNKTYRHDITEIALKVALNTINQRNIFMYKCTFFFA